MSYQIRVFSLFLSSLSKEMLAELLRAESTRAEPHTLGNLVTHRSEKLVRQSQIVQSVMQDCQYVLSHLLPAGN